MNKFTQILAALGLISLIIACRLGPHPANFAPVGASMIIAGLYFKGRFRYLIPFAGLIISDLFLGFYAWQIMLAVYASYGLIYLISHRVKSRPNEPLPAASCGVSGKTKHTKFHSPKPKWGSSPALRFQLRRVRPPSSPRQAAGYSAKANNWLPLALSSSIIFFIVTNFSVWLFGSLYPHDWSGFWQCYLMAIPFFRWTLAGDLFYVLILAASFEFIHYAHRVQLKTRLLDKLLS